MPHRQGERAILKDHLALAVNDVMAYHVGKLHPPMTCHFKDRIVDKLGEMLDSARLATT